jgi:chemotaxis protein methyltransferase CheR
MSRVMAGGGLNPVDGGDGNRRPAGKEFAFTTRDFERVRSMIRARAGIALGEGKQEMVYSRLARRLRATGCASFSDYLDQLEGGGSDDDWQDFTNALTTNLTSFFRESHHFPMLAEHALALRSPKPPSTSLAGPARPAPQRPARDGAPYSVWCAASSTGEEPYSIAMTLCEAFDSLQPPVRIVATDIDTAVLDVASAGVYPMEKLERLDPARLRRFFLRGRGARQGFARIRPELRAMVTFSQLNLLAGSWSLAAPFDAVFCRNVMIYFDKPTQAAILSRMVPLMAPDGLLFAGHSENFLYVSDALRLRGRTVYQLRGAHGA